MSPNNALHSDGPHVARPAGELGLRRSFNRERLWIVLLKRIFDVGCCVAAQRVPA